MNLVKFTPEQCIVGEDEEETLQLKSMCHESKSYILSFNWCPPIREIFLGFGVGGVVALFLIRFTEGIMNMGDEYLWVIVGDVPSAYLVIDEAPTAKKALEIYCSMMQDWIDAVKSHNSLDNVFPVEAPADIEHADMLQSRIDFIRNKILQYVE